MIAFVLARFWCKVVAGSKHFICESFEVPNPEGTGKSYTHKSTIYCGNESVVYDARLRMAGDDLVMESINGASTIRLASIDNVSGAFFSTSNDWQGRFFQKLADGGRTEEEWFCVVEKKRSGHAKTCCLPREMPFPPYRDQASLQSIPHP